MPKVRWGISASDIDEYDRDNQYTPYTGPTPPNAVYQWQVKVLKYVAGGRESHDQLRIGLELVPRKGRKDEAKYAGYFVMKFCHITSKAAFTYVPFLDAIGASGDDFKERTISDEEGNIKKIGRWRNNGDEILMGQLIERPDTNQVLRKEVSWIGPLAQDEDELDDDDDEYSYYEDEDEEIDSDGDDEEPF